LPTNALPGFDAYIYPNPAQDNAFIYVDVNSYGNFLIKLFDLLGQQIMGCNLQEAQPFNIPLGTARLASGAYLIQVSRLDVKNETKILKLIKL
jgi:Secretion system C-terminal sorting domain